MASNKLEKILNNQVRVILQDGRHIVGTLLAYDAHMNIVLDEGQEFRTTKKAERVQRPVGLVILRGETIVSTILESTYSGAKERKQPIVMKIA